MAETLKRKFKVTNARKKEKIEMKMKMKRTPMIMLVIVLLIASIGFTACGSDSGDGDVKIGIVQIVDHPSLNTIRDNIVSQLEEEGFVDGENCTIDIQDAQNEQSNLKTICQKFSNESYDIIIPISTPAAQAAAGETSEIPIVFSAVTDPIEAGLISNPVNPDKNVTGVSDAVSAEKILDTALEITPNIGTLGILYTSSEANSQSVVDEMKYFCEQQRIKVEEVSITASNEIQQAVTDLIGNCDALFTPIDNTVAASMPTVVDAANKAKMPYYVGADSMVADGALATDGVNYSELGVETGKMAAKVLNGTKIAELPVLTMEETTYYYNPDTAKTIGVKIPDIIKEKGVELTGE